MKNKTSFQKTVTVNKSIAVDILNKVRTYNRGQWLKVAGLPVVFIEASRECFIISYKGKYLAVFPTGIKPVFDVNDCYKPERNPSFGDIVYTGILPHNKKPAFSVYHSRQGLGSYHKPYYVRAFHGADLDMAYDRYFSFINARPFIERMRLQCGNSLSN